MKKVNLDNVLSPTGHYTPSVIYNNIIFISGQLPIDPVTGDKKNGTIEQEAKQTLNNLESILIQAGSSKEKVIKVTIFISDISFWDNVNSIYADFFGEHKPARSIVPTGKLHHGFKIEIEAIAAIN
ncbi:RidA family protein [Proteiniborus sp.]|uniref:RidA family protein n=1 Tax=Proteiniborus sp. TaxID=2079015 RepID=UPI0033254D87